MLDFSICKQRRAPVEVWRLVWAGGAAWLFPRLAHGTEPPKSTEGWLSRRLPAALKQSGPFDIVAWQWLALPLLVVVALFFGALFTRVTRRLLAVFVKRTAIHWDDLFVERLTGPLNLAWSLLIFSALLPWLELRDPVGSALRGAVRAGVLLSLFWGVLRLIDVGVQAIAVSDWVKDRAGTRALLPLGARVTKLIVGAIAMVALLSEFGYPVASLIAGLGIGGVAVALGAQKTFENLFGAFSIGADQPLREGDFVRIEDFVGTVESIGLRSTRIRTLDRTIITLPNGKLADTRIETFAVRDRLRLACLLGLVYGTNAAQMRAVLSGLRAALREHPKIWSETIVVHFKEFGESSLNVEVMAWFTTSDWNEFMQIREDMLLLFMEIVEREGSAFAFPTRTLHIEPAQSG